MASAKMSRFPIHDEETAPADSAALLKIASAAGGQLPNFLGVLSNSPAALRAFLRFRQELGKGELAPATRARIGIAVAAHQGSERTDLRLAARGAGLGLDEIARARRWASEDPREQTPAMGVALEEVEGGVLMRSSTSDLGWMARVLAGLSFPFLVKGPPELREELKRHAAGISRLAEGTG